MSTVIKYDERLPKDLVALRSINTVTDAEQLYLDHVLMVIDDVPWRADIKKIAAWLPDQKRKFDDPFRDRPIPPRIQKEVDTVIEQMRELFRALFTFKFTDRFSSGFRPLITGPEPLHFDSYKKGTKPIVTSYANVSNEPRHYRIANNFPGMMKAHGKEVHKLNTPGRDATYELRVAGEAGIGPMGPKAPRHDVYLAPGAVWFFNAKTVAHEVFYGRGAIGVSWELADARVMLPIDLLALHG